MALRNHYIPPERKRCLPLTRLEAHLYLSPSATRVKRVGAKGSVMVSLEARFSACHDAGYRLLVRGIKALLVRLPHTQGTGAL